MKDHHDIESTSLFRPLSFWNLSQLCLHVSETFPHHVCMSVKPFPIMSACQWSLSPSCLHVSEAFPHRVCMSVKPFPIVSACQWNLSPSCLHVSETFPKDRSSLRPLCLKPFPHISVSVNPSPKTTLLVKTTSEKRLPFKSPCLWNLPPKTYVLFKTTFPFVSQCQRTPCTRLFKATSETFQFHNTILVNPSPKTTPFWRPLFSKTFQFHNTMLINPSLKTTPLFQTTFSGSWSFLLLFPLNC